MMRKADILLAVPVLLGLPLLLHAQTACPRLTAVSATKAKAGDVLTATGKNLDRADLAALYLTDGKIDTKVTIIDETGASITFKVPAAVKPGRLALMVLTTGDTPKLYEEPVKVTIQ